MKIPTTRFGELEVEDSRIIRFPLGIPGFAESKRYFLIDYKESIWWLQSVDDPDLAFIVTDPFSLFPDYSFKIGDDMETLLEIQDPQQIAVLALLSIDVSGVSVNLRAPLVINSAKFCGAQVLVEDERYSFKTAFPKPTA